MNMIWVFKEQDKFDEHGIAIHKVLATNLGSMHLSSQKALIQCIARIKKTTLFSFIYRHYIQGDTISSTCIGHEILKSFC
jgi:hypothetical protein